MRGDLQEGNGCACRCQFPRSLVPIPFFPITTSAFLCFFALRNPRFRAFRAQNQVFCALLTSETAVFGLFEHKIGIFVRFWGPEPLFSDISSTKSAFLCAFGVWNPCFRAFRAQNRGFCALLPAGRAEQPGRAEFTKKRVANVVTLLSFASLL